MNFIVPLVVYPFDVMVSFGESDKDIKMNLNYFNIGDSDLWMYETDNDAGRCCSFKGNKTLIRLRKSPKTDEDYSFLQHEIFHAVTMIMHKIGIRLSIGKSDEAYAYLIGYLTKKIYEKIK